MEIERDERRLAIGWNDPQLPVTAISLSDGRLENAEEFIPFTGADGIAQTEPESQPGEKAQPASRPRKGKDSTPPHSPWPIDGSGDWSEDE